MGIIIIIIAIILLPMIWGVVSYNGMVKLKITAEGSWSDIDVILKKRHNLIPNLVETVKGYAKHESETLEKVIQARNQAINISADDVENKVKAENMLSQTLRSLFAVSENYPNLKADKHFNDLMRQLQQIETEVERARRYYNAVVRDYNVKIQIFPNSMIAGMGGFSKLTFYEVEDESFRENVKVKF